MHKKLMIGINNGHIKATAQIAIINAQTISPIMKANMTLNMLLMISHIFLPYFLTYL
jgi:hypothetical protein